MIRHCLWAALLLAAASAQAEPLPVLTGDGLGALRVGMTRHEAERAIGRHVRLDANSSDDIIACAGGTISAMPDVGLLLENLRIRVIWIGGRMATSDGVQLGTTEDELRRIFGTRAVFGPRPYFDEDATAHNVVVRLRGKREFLFQTEHGKVTTISVGDRPAVEYWEGCA